MQVAAAAGVAALRKGADGKKKGSICVKGAMRGARITIGVVIKMHVWGTYIQIDMAAVFYVGTTNGDVAACLCCAHPPASKAMEPKPGNCRCVLIVHLKL